MVREVMLVREVTVREHVGEAERVIVVFRQQLEERLDAVVTRKPK